MQAVVRVHLIAIHERNFRHSSFYQVHELFDAQIRIGNDAPESAPANRPMIWHNNACIWPLAPKNHVASLLSAEDKSNALQRPPHIPTRQICRELCHLGGLYFDELPSRLSWHGIAGFAAILDVQLNGFSNVR